MIKTFILTFLSKNILLSDALDLQMAFRQESRNIAMALF